MNTCGYTCNVRSTIISIDLASTSNNEALDVYCCCAIHSHARREHQLTPPNHSINEIDHHQNTRPQPCINWRIMRPQRFIFVVINTCVCGGVYSDAAGDVDRHHGGQPTLGSAEALRRLSKAH